MSKLFKERIPFKPFEYPIYYTEGWLKQAQAFWLHTEIPMQGDVKDWNEKKRALRNRGPDRVAPYNKARPTPRPSRSYPYRCAVPRGRPTPV